MLTGRSFLVHIAMETLMPTSEKFSIGVPNPRALSEIVLGRAIDWTRVVNPNAIVEQALGVKYSELFDPKYKTSPLFAGLRSESAPTPTTKPLKETDEDALK